MLAFGEYKKAGRVEWRCLGEVGRQMLSTRKEHCKGRLLHRPGSGEGLRAAECHRPAVSLQRLSLAGVWERD